MIAASPCHADAPCFAPERRRADYDLDDDIEDDPDEDDDEDEDEDDEDDDDDEDEDVETWQVGPAVRFR